MKNENCDVGDIGEMFPVKRIIERQKIITGKDHRADESGTENETIVIRKFKKEAQYGNNNRCYKIQRTEILNFFLSEFFPKAD